MPVDIDPRNGGDGTIAEVIAEHGLLPRTRTANTGGGTHLYFRGGAQARSGPGVDLKGTYRTGMPPARSG